MRLAVDHHDALALQPEIDLGLGMAVQGKVITRLHHGNAANQTVSGGHIARKQCFPAQGAPRRIIPTVVGQVACVNREGVPHGEAFGLPVLLRPF